MSYPADVEGALETHITAVLVGGPESLPVELRRRRVNSSEERVKVPHYGGYEHFQRRPEWSGGVSSVLADPTAFTWVGRTRIAE